MKVFYGEARDPDIYYHCGFDSDVHVLFIDDEKKTLYVPGFEYLRAREETKGAIEVKELEEVDKLLSSLTKPVTINKLFPYWIADKIKGKKLVEQNLVQEREIKKPEEITLLEEAQQVARETIDLLIKKIESATIEGNTLYEGGEALTSEYLKHVGRSYLQQRGYDCADIIISSGEQTKYPHNRGSNVLRTGPIIIDVFPQSNQHRYHGDMTRTIIIGEHLEAAKQLGAVVQVHDEIIEKLLPGVKIKELHNYCIKRLEELGYTTTEDRGMIHSLGHGVGLAIHEQPSVGPNSEETLKKGMVLTIEPGLYYDVGVRHENLFVIEDKARML